MAILEVPLEADGEVLTVNLDADLPDDPSEICTLLENENCAAEYWLAFAAAYARTNQGASAAEIATKGIEAPICKTMEDRQPFYSFLGWLSVRDMRDADLQSKPEIYAKALEYSNKAYQLGQNDPSTLLVKAALSLSTGNYNDSLVSAQAILSKDADNCWARLVRARVLYQRKNYRGALQLYQSVLNDQPGADMRPDPRLGVGLCFWQLGDHEHALLAWTRALQLDSQNVGAQTLIGIYHLEKALHELSTAEEFEQHYRAAIDAMQDAYLIDKKEASLASIIIASYLFSKQNIEAVHTLTNQVLQRTSLPSLVSDAWFWKGRAYHQQNEYKSALECYNQAHDADQSNLAALLAKGTIELLIGAPDALITLEKAVNNNPKDPNSSLLCGLAYFERSSDEKYSLKATSYLEKYVNLAKSAGAPVRSEALLALSELYERKQQIPPIKALEYIQEAIAAMTEDGKKSVPLSAIIHNNRGVLAYYCGKFEEARQCFDNALNSSDYTNYKATIDFNIARLDDGSGQPDAARKGYTAILESYPGYADAQIRNAYLDVVLGSFEDGENAMTKLMETHPKNLEARALNGWYIRRKIRAGKKVGEAEQLHYKQTLMDVDKHDSYSLVAMGNMYLMNARDIRPKNSSELERKDKAYYKASEFFDKALQIDPYNAYAAQGIAIILAETKRFRQALQILDRACETIGDPSVFVNSGHCLMELKEYNKAIEMYEQAISRTQGKDATLLTLAGRAWYARAGSTKDPESFKTALDYSTKSLELHPESASLRWNVAYLQCQFGDLVRRLPAEQRSAKLISEAITSVKEAVETLRVVAKSSQPPFKPADIEKRAVMCESTLIPQLEKAQEAQEELERESKAKVEEARRIREEEKEKAEAERKRKREELDARERELEEERIKLQEQTSKWEEERAAAKEVEEPHPKKRRKSTKRKEEEIVADDSEVEYQSNNDSDSEQDTKNDRKMVVSDESDGELDGLF